MESPLDQLGHDARTTQYMAQLPLHGRSARPALLGRRPHRSGQQVLALGERPAGRIRGRSQKRPQSAGYLLRRGGAGSLPGQGEEHDRRAAVVFRQAVVLAQRQRQGRSDLRLPDGRFRHSERRDLEVRDERRLRNLRQAGPQLPPGRVEHPLRRAQKRRRMVHAFVRRPRHDPGGRQRTGRMPALEQAGQAPDPAVEDRRVARLRLAETQRRLDHLHAAL